VTGRPSRELVHLHQRMIHSLAYRMSGSLADADDLAQETFIRAYHGLPELPGAPPSFASWLYRIALNVCLRWRRAEAPARRRRHRVARRRRNMGTAPNRRVDRLQEALGQLAPKLRAAVILTAFEGRSHAEAADLARLPRDDRLVAALRRPAPARPPPHRARKFAMTPEELKSLAQASAEPAWPDSHWEAFPGRVVAKLAGRRPPDRRAPAPETRHCARRGPPPAASWPASPSGIRQRRQGRDLRVAAGRPDAAGAADSVRRPPRGHRPRPERAPHPAGEGPRASPRPTRSAWRSATATSARWSSRSAGSRSSSRTGP
jgi:RNA polymerase sigma factor (sigma-70 family)